jgi:hypothetical protein
MAEGSAAGRQLGVDSVREHPVSENRTKQAEQGDAPRILQTDKDNTCVASWLKLPCVRKI